MWRKARKQDKKEIEITMRGMTLHCMAEANNSTTQNNQPVNKNQY